MGKVLLSIIFLVIGGVIGFAGGSMLGAGAGAGVGIATGTSAGICATVEAAVAEGLLSPEQVDQVLTRAAADMAAISGNDSPEAMVGAVADCEQIMERLRTAAN